MRASRRRRPTPLSGFTLIELLIAASLVTLVLGMAMTGFSSVKKTADLNRSKAIAQEEATNGVHQLSTMLRKATVLYYSARPLIGNGAGEPVAGLPAANTEPGTLHALPFAGAGAQPKVPYLMGSPYARPSQHLRATGPTRDVFRFTPVVANGLPLPAAQQTFGAPLAFWAEAQFCVDPAAVGVNTYANLPNTWDFYLLYLCPMDLTNGGAAPTDDNALCPATDGGTNTVSRAIRDLGKPMTVGGPQWTRSTIPFEMRLLTVRGVSAMRGAVPIAAPFGYLTDPAPAPMVGVLPVPYDANQNTINYDPIPLAGGLGAALRPNLPPTNLVQNPYTRLAGTNPPPCSVRVFGTGEHTNYNSLANDPPTEAVFTNQALMATSSDRVIANYIDPDNPEGTSVRFINEQAGAAGTAQRYVPVYQGPYWCNGATTPPSRVQINVTTRYRTGKDLPFQFSTQTEEISLDGVASYHTFAGSRMTR